MEVNKRSDEIIASLSSGTPGKFLAIQNRRVLGVFATYDEAVARCNEEIQKDRYELLLKRTLLRSLIKKLNKGDCITDYYIVAEVQNYEIPKLF